MSPPRTVAYRHLSVSTIRAQIVLIYGRRQFVWSSEVYEIATSQINTRTNYKATRNEHITIVWNEVGKLREFSLYKKNYN